MLTRLRHLDLAPDTAVSRSEMVVRREHGAGGGPLEEPEGDAEHGGAGGREQGAVQDGEAQPGGAAGQPEPGGRGEEPSGGPGYGRPGDWGKRGGPSEPGT